jgi:hypothetical protein
MERDGVVRKATVYSSVVFDAHQQSNFFGVSLREFSRIPGLEDESTDIVELCHVDLLW